MEEEILNTARSICACTEQEETLLARLCTAAAKRLRGELREDVSERDCAEAFACAAAWLAAAALTEARLCGGEELSSLRAGDVTIQMKDGARSGRADALRRSARQMMEPYTKGGGFYFCGVKG